MASIIKKTLLSSLKMAKSCLKSPYICRTLTTSKRLAGNYEGDGKTIVTILNREYKHLIMIDSFSSYGFRLNNGLFAIGSVAAFPRTILQWNITNVAEITPESLSLFCLLEPKLDILVLGTGDKKLFPNKYVLEYLSRNKISTEILSTEMACATFNFLNVEGRCVAGAFIPPTEVHPYEDEWKLIETFAIDDYRHIENDPRDKSHV